MTELSTKAGIDNPLLSNSSVRNAQEEVGRYYTNTATRFATEKDISQQTMSLGRFVPKNGYLPVQLVSHATSVVEASQANRYKIPRQMLMKRPRYQIEPALQEATQEYFSKVVRPRLSLLDSEELALH